MWPQAPTIELGQVSSITLFVGGGFGEAIRVAVGFDKGVAQQPVDMAQARGGRQLVKSNCDWHSFVEGEVACDLQEFRMGSVLDFRGEDGSSSAIQQHRQKGVG